MPRFIGSKDANQGVVLETKPVASGVTVTEGDFVYETSGRVSSASIAGARLVGLAQSTITGNSAGTNTVLVNTTPQALFLVDNDNVGTTFAATHVGQYMDLIGATGAQLADTSTVSTTTNQLRVVEYNSEIAQGDISQGVFMIAEHANKL